MASPFDNNPQIQYDLRAAQIEGLSAADIAQYVSQRRNYDYDAARKAGLTDEDIIQYNVANVSDQGAYGAAFEEFATTTPVGLASGAVGTTVGGIGARTGARVGAGIGGRVGGALGAVGGPMGALAGAGVGATVGAGLGFLTGGLIGLIGGTAAAAIPARAGIDKLKETLDLGRQDEQLLPSAQKGRVFGETAGFTVGALASPFAYSRAIESAAKTGLGRALGLGVRGEIQQAGTGAFVPNVNPVNLGSTFLFENAANNVGMANSLAKAVRNLEQSATAARAARASSPKLGVTGALAAGTAMGAAGAVAETLDPGNLYLRIPAEIATGFSPLGIAYAIGRREAARAAAASEGRAENQVVKVLTRIVDDVDAGQQAAYEQRMARYNATPAAERGPKPPEYQGVDTEEIARRLESDDVGIPKELLGEKNLPPFSGYEKSGDEIMKIFQATLADMSGSPALERGKKQLLRQSTEAVKQMGAILDNLAQFDSPAVMQAVSLSAEEYYRQLMEAALNGSIARAMQQGERLATKGQDGRRVKRVIEDGTFKYVPEGDALGDADRAAAILIESGIERPYKLVEQAENRAWSKVDKRIEAPVNKIYKFWLEKTNPSRGGSQAAENLYIRYLQDFMKESIDPLYRDAYKKQLAEIENNFGQLTSLRGQKSVLERQIRVLNSELKEAETTAQRELAELGPRPKEEQPTGIALLDMTDEQIDALNQYDFKVDEIRTGVDQIERNLNTKITELGGVETSISNLDNLVRSSNQIIDDIVSKTFVPVGRLLEFRSQMLKNARITGATEAGASQSGYYGSMARRALDDIMTIGGQFDKSGAIPTRESLEQLGFTAKNIEAVEKQIQAITNARALSYAKNEVFDRAFGGTLLAKDSSGAKRVDPLELARKFIVTSGSMTAQNFKQLDDAMDFAIANVTPTQANELRALKQYELDGAKEIILRDVFANREGIIRPKGKQRQEINVDALDQVLNKYQKVLALPGMKSVEEDLRKAATLQAELDKYRDDIVGAGFKLDKSKRRVGVQRATGPARDFEGIYNGPQKADIDAFRMFLDVPERPVEAMLAILDGGKRTNAPEASLRGLAKLAKRADTGEFGTRPGNAVGGLKEVVLNAAIEKSRNPNTGIIDFAAFGNFLISPLNRNQKNPKTILDVLVEENVVDDQFRNGLVTITDLGERINRSLMRGQTPEGDEAFIQEVMENNMFISAGAGAMGAGIFSNLIRRAQELIGFRGSSGELVSAGLGAKLASRYLEKLPSEAALALMIETAQDPKVAARMMRQIRNPKDVREFHLALQPQLETILGSTTYQNIAEYLQSPEFEMEATETVEETPLAAAPAQTPSEPLVNVPEPIPAMPVPPPPPVNATVPLPQLPVPGGSSNRSQYAAMFPFDSVSEVIRTQEGIGSLMQ